MNIAIVVDDFHGGSGNIAQLLALNLKQNHKVSIILTNEHSEPRYNLECIDRYSMNLSASGKNKAVGIIGLIKRLGNLIKKDIKANLVISFIDNNNTMTCFSQFFNKTPIIVAERSNPLVIFPKSPWDKLRRIAYKRANVVTVQFKCFDGFDGGRFIKKTRVTSNIVDKPKCVKQNYDCEKVKFVTMGRLAPIKRMDLMIELFDEAAKKCPDIELHIFGDGPEREKLESLISEKNLCGKVFLDGYCNDVHKTLCDHDVYLMTSRQEGFPNSLSEAMAVGLPSVSFACHEGIDELTESGKSGFAVTEGDREVFVNKLIALAENASLRKEMGANAMHIIDKYDVDIIMKQWQNCIDEAMGKAK